MWQGLDTKGAGKSVLYLYRIANNSLVLKDERHRKNDIYGSLRKCLPKDTELGKTIYHMAGKTRKQ